MARKTSEPVSKKLHHVTNGDGEIVSPTRGVGAMLEPPPGAEPITNGSKRGTTTKARAAQPPGTEPITNGTKRGSRRGVKAPAEAAQPAVDTQIVLPALNIQFMKIRLVGDSSLICHRWSTKARAEMLAKQMGKAKQAKAPKNPEEDVQESLYPHPEGGFGFPAIAFKAAAVDACSHISGVTKVEARGSFHIIGELVKVHGEPTPREDMVRIAMGTADIRYRGEFKSWSADLSIRYNANMLTPEQIANLFNTAGFAIGVGEWRPQKDGSYGMFHVE